MNRTYKYTRPKFCKERYNKFDEEGKEAAIGFFTNFYKDSVIVQIEENYQDDVVVSLPKLGFENLKVQTEIRQTWIKGKFPYKTLQLSKSKVDDCLYRDTQTIFLVFSKDLSSVAYLRLSKNINKKVISKINKLSPEKPEEFYEFELDLIDFYFSAD